MPVKVATLYMYKHLHIGRSLMKYLFKQEVKICKIVMFMQIKEVYLCAQYRLYLNIPIFKYRYI